MKIKSSGTVLYKIHGSVFQRGKMHGLSFSTKMQLFEENGITIVVAMAPTKVDLDLLSMDRDHSFIEYIYKPISDGMLQDRTKEMLLDLAKRISKVIVKHDAKVLCHCNAGRNRSGLMNALILRNLLKCSGEQAMEIVRCERPRAIANRNFEDFLRSLK